MERMMYIGIDPDLIKSGVATWISKPEKLDVTTLDFFDLMAYIKDCRVTDNNLMVFLEAGWKNKKANFHHATGSNMRERIAKNVGENHAVGKMIEQFLKREGIQYWTITPTSNKWDADVFRAVTGLKQRTNSEMRDAAKLVFGR